VLHAVYVSKRLFAHRAEEFEIVEIFCQDPVVSFLCDALDVCLALGTNIQPVNAGLAVISVAFIAAARLFHDKCADATDEVLLCLIFEVIFSQL
jgi:hypothetical protein